MSKGVIYVLTNPSFPEYVKIGYADDLEKRLTQLNRSECLPFAFRAYCVYQVEGKLKDKEVHALIDKLNPDLRSIDTFNGKPRIREFYNISAEDAYDILHSIAMISGTVDKLKMVAPEGHEIEDEKEAAENSDAENIVYKEEDHFLHSTPKTKKLYETLRSKLTALEGVEILPRKLYVAFKTTTNICDVEIQQKKLKVTINMKMGELDDPQNLTKNVEHKGSWGNGDYQFLFEEEDQLDYLMNLIMQSYDKHRNE